VWISLQKELKTSCKEVQLADQPQLQLLRAHFSTRASWVIPSPWLNKGALQEPGYFCPLEGPLQLRGLLGAFPCGWQTLCCPVLHHDGQMGLPQLNPAACAHLSDLTEQKTFCSLTSVSASASPKYDPILSSYIKIP
jgi:hypothetical protein